MRDHRVKYLAGCASVPLDNGSLNLGALRSELMSKHLAPEDFRVEPIRGLQSLGVKRKPPRYAQHFLGVRAMQ